MSAYIPKAKDYKLNHWYNVHGKSRLLTGFQKCCYTPNECSNYNCNSDLLWDQKTEAPDSTACGFLNGKPIFEEVFETPLTFQIETMLDRIQRITNQIKKEVNQT